MTLIENSIKNKADKLADEGYHFALALAKLYTLFGSAKHRELIPKILGQAYRERGL